MLLKRCTQCVTNLENSAVATGLEKVSFNSSPKERHAKEYSDYQTIMLISSTNKVKLKILHARLQQYVNWELPDVQAGFKKSRETKDQIANIRWIIEKTREFQKNIYFCFIVLAWKIPGTEESGGLQSMGSHRIRHHWSDLAAAAAASLTMQKPLTVWISTNCGKLLEMGIPDHLTCLIRNLYVDQEKAVRILYGTSDWLKTEKTVYQSCISSPSLFSLYAEYIMQSAGLDEFTSWSQDCWEKY